MPARAWAPASYAEVVPAGGRHAAIADAAGLGAEPQGDAGEIALDAVVAGVRVVSIFEVFACGSVALVAMGFRTTLTDVQDDRAEEVHGACRGVS